MRFRKGERAIIEGLVEVAALNGREVEILTGLRLTDVPEPDGVTREALRYGVRVIGTTVTGWVRPKHLRRL